MNPLLLSLCFPIFREGKHISFLTLLLIILSKHPSPFNTLQISLILGTPPRVLSFPPKSLALLGLNSLVWKAPQRLPPSTPFRFPRTVQMKVLGEEEKCFPTCPTSLKNCSSLQVVSTTCYYSELCLPFLHGLSVTSWPPTLPQAGHTGFRIAAALIT